MSRSACAVSLVSILTTIGIIGCAQNSGEDNIKVSGTVTLDGQPLDSGSISFFPSDGVGTTASGIIEKGAFTAEVPPGTKRIEITATKVVGQRKTYDTPDSPMTEITEELIPERYNRKSELTTTVTLDGDNSLTLELNSTESQ